MKTPMRLIAIVFMLALSLGAQAQGAPEPLLVTFQYTDEPLGVIMEEAQQRYRLQFLYSSDLIPVKQTVSVDVKRVPLKQGLQALFESTQVVFLLNDEQVWLRLDPFKVVPRKEPAPMGEIILPTRDPVKMLPFLSARRLPDSLQSYRPSALPKAAEGEVETLFGRQEARQKVWLDSLNALLPPGHNIIQASLTPGLSTLSSNPTLITNYTSFNLLWGWHGGLKGLELGVGVNMIVNDADGLQVAGVGNLVNDAFRGLQIGGLGNFARHVNWGAQVGGVANIAQTNEALQVSGGMNISWDTLRGAQVAGVANMGGRGSSTTSVQLSGLGNVALGDIGVQVGALYNQAERVENLQLGLVNVADTVVGTSIGFLNIVRHGYNRFELSGGEALWLNGALKLGSESFYNIFQAGARWYPGYISDHIYWSLGYGVGRATRLSGDWRMNSEVVVQHLMEGNDLYPQLNLLGQFRLTFEWQPRERTGLFIGPVWNTYLSQVDSPETGQLGFPIVPYSLVDFTPEEGPRVQTWVGVTAGLRF
jgi:hypothetical protein